MSKILKVLLLGFLICSLGTSAFAAPEMMAAKSKKAKAKKAKKNLAKGLAALNTDPFSQKDQ